MTRYDLRAVVPKNTLANHLRGQTPRGIWLALYDRLGLKPECWMTRGERRRLDRLIDKIDKAKPETIQS